MSIKNLWNKDREKPEKICPVTGPWLIDTIENGLEARSVKEKLGMIVGKNKGVPTQYYENDRIYGKNAFESEGILRVMDMFDELQDITPLTTGFLFKGYAYVYHKKGILKRKIGTKEKSFYSDESLRNESLANYFQLDYNSDPTYEEDNTDREEVLSKNTELQTTTDPR